MMRYDVHHITSVRQKKSQIYDTKTWHCVLTIKLVLMFLFIPLNLSLTTCIECFKGHGSHVGVSDKEVNLNSFISIFFYFFFTCTETPIWRLRRQVQTLYSYLPLLCCKELGIYLTFNGQVALQTMDQSLLDLNTQAIPDFFVLCTSPVKVAGALFVLKDVF